MESNGLYCEWRNVNYKLPQGSVPGLPLFNIYFSNLLLVSDSMLCNYADDTTIYACNYKTEETTRKLENDIAILSNWFRDNSM